MTDKDATKLYKLLNTMYKQHVLCKYGNRAERCIQEPELIKIIDSDSPEINAVLVIESVNNPILFTYFLNNGKIVADYEIHATHEGYARAVDTLSRCLDNVCEVCDSLAEVAWYRDDTMAVTTSDGKYTRYVVHGGIAVEEER